MNDSFRISDFTLYLASVAAALSNAKSLSERNSHITLRRIEEDRLSSSSSQRLCDMAEKQPVGSYAPRTVTVSLMSLTRSRDN